MDFFPIVVPPLLKVVALLAFYIPLVNQSSNLYSQEKGLSLPKALPLEEGRDFWYSTGCVRTNLDCHGFPGVQHHQKGLSSAI